ncbi:hypothetical protein [Massilia sp. Dwa41.01b]|uniref:hypothetical protein n=1 Tax=Massilia sp. Dwa41.01b TaxID=2709302 RepID=UPI001602D29E|nr:hypothetical protein [Massilia sp. Dwa41.01b]
MSIIEKAASRIDHTRAPAPAPVVEHDDQAIVLEPHAAPASAHAAPAIETFEPTPAEAAALAAAATAAPAHAPAPARAAAAPVPPVQARSGGHRPGAKRAPARSTSTWRACATPAW